MSVLNDISATCGFCTTSQKLGLKSNKSKFHRFGLLNFLQKEKLLPIIPITAGTTTNNIMWDF
jgi:hypothetical protein